LYEYIILYFDTSRARPRVAVAHQVKSLIGPCRKLVNVFLEDPFNSNAMSHENENNGNL
jgi:hypothetical protein